MWEIKQIEQYRCFAPDGNYIGAYSHNLFDPEFEKWLDLGLWGFTNRDLGKTELPTYADTCDQYGEDEEGPIYICYVEACEEFWDCAAFMR